MIFIKQLHLKPSSSSQVPRRESSAEGGPSAQWALARFWGAKPAAGLGLGAQQSNSDSEIRDGGEGAEAGGGGGSGGGFRV